MSKFLTSIALICTDWAGLINIGSTLFIKSWLGCSQEFIKHGDYQL